MRLLFFFVFLLGLFSCGEDKKASMNVNDKNSNGVSKNKNSQIVHIPDAKFKKCLIENKDINTNRDNEIQRSEAESYSGDDLDYEGINVFNKGIKDLTGIEAFISLRILNCGNNQLSALDLSKNKSLVKLSCEDNQLKSLDISKNTALTYLKCLDNQLSSLDVSVNINLTVLRCGMNNLKSLNVSNNTSLNALRCGINQLSALDLYNNTALTKLDCSFNQLSSLDVSKNTALTWLVCFDNQLNSLDVSKNTALTELRCGQNPLNCVTGVPSTCKRFNGAEKCD